MKTKTTEETLKCILTPEEKRNYSEELAHRTTEALHLEDSKKQVTSEYAAKINATKAHMSSLAIKITNGYEHRDVKCRWDYDWDEGSKHLIREDTREVIREEAITAQERQIEMELETKSV